MEARLKEIEAKGTSSAPQLSVGDLARLAEVSPRTIRYYEEIGLLKTAKRFAGGRRAFDGDALERLRFIGRLKRLGLALDEIRHLNDVFDARHSTGAMLEVLEALLGTHLETIGERLRELSQLRDDISAYRNRILGRLGAGNDGKGNP